MITSLLLMATLSGTAPAQRAAPADNPLVGAYIDERANLQWGTQLYCGGPREAALLRRFEQRMGRIRAALASRIGDWEVDLADDRAERRFDEEFENLGLGAGCKRGDPAMARKYYAGFRNSHEPSLRSLEAALGLRR